MAMLASALLTPVMALSDQGNGLFPAPAIISEEAREMAYETIWENLRIAVFDQKKTGSEHWSQAPAGEARDSAIVYLISKYENGSTITGSGTIIMGRDGVGRVLTAGHVVPLESIQGENMTRLIEILAFSNDGQLMASLYPKVTGYDGRNPPDIHNIHPSDISSDIAVLEVEYFPNPKFEGRWLKSAVRIAETQPAAIFAIAAGRDSAINNPGISGASLRNADGEVVGIVSHCYHTEDAPVAKSGSDYLQRLSAKIAINGDAMSIGPTVIGLLKMAGEPNQSPPLIGGVGLGAPVLQQEVLEALHAGPVNATSSADSFYAHMAGFPDSEILSAEIIATELERYEASDHLKPETMASYEWNPMYIELDPIVIGCDCDL